MIIIKTVMSYFIFMNVKRLIGGDQSGIKSAVTVGYAEMNIIYGTTQKN